MSLFTPRELKGKNAKAEETPNRLTNPTPQAHPGAANPKNKTTAQNKSVRAFTLPPEAVKLSLSRAANIVFLG